MVRQGLLQMDNVSLGLSKWGLIIFNMVFWLMGVVSLGIGLWLYTNWNEFATFSDGGRLYGSVFLVATGVGVVIVGFMGIVAALRESRILATMFAVMTLLALGMYVFSGGWSLWARGRLEQDLREDLETAIVEYDTVPTYSTTWDELHVRYECCGVDSVTDWEELRNPLIPRAPPSCCVNQTNCVVFHAKGCLQDLMDYEKWQLDIIGPIGLAFGTFQVVGLVVWLVFCVSLHNTKGSYYT